MDIFGASPTQLHELIDKLTPRQLQVVELLALGKSRRQIATILSISPETVKTHVWKICRKLDAENRIQLAVMYAVWRAGKELQGQVSKTTL